MEADTLLESPGCWRKVTADSQRARWCWSRGCSGKEHCGRWLGLCIPARIHSLLGDTLQVQSRSKGSVERTFISARIFYHSKFKASANSASASPRWWSRRRRRQWHLGQHRPRLVRLLSWTTGSSGRRSRWTTGMSTPLSGVHRRETCFMC